MASPKDIAHQNDSAHLTFLHCNARSARNKYDELTTFLDEFCFRFDIIMITETWYTCEEEVFRLAGYNSFYLNRSSRRGGGVLKLISERLSCSLLTEFTAITPDYEALALIQDNHVYVVLYRPPDGCIEKFYVFLEKLLNFVGTNKLYVVIGGDCNINLLQSNSTSRSFKLLLDSYACTVTLNEPTHVGVHSESLLDIFITNNRNDCVTSGSVISDISDHFPIYMIYKKNKVSRHLQTSPSEPYQIRQINTKTLEQFRHQIAELNFSALYNCTNADEAYDTLMHF